MVYLLKIRRVIIKYTRQFELPIKIAAKLCVGLYIFNAIGKIGNYAPQLSKLLQGSNAPFLVMLLVIGFALAPTTLAFGLAAGWIVAQTSANLEMCVFIAITCLLVLVFYVRLAPKAAWLLFATIFAYWLNIPYVIVLFSGIYIGAAAVAPIALGCWAVTVMPKLVALMGGGSVLSGLPADLSAGLQNLDVQALSTNAVDSINAYLAAILGGQGWVVAAFVFAVVVLGMKAATHAPVNYAKEISLGFGMFATIVCLLAVGSIMDAAPGVLSVILGSFVSALIVLFIRLFDSLPNYAATERVQFEDEDNIYYVKVVPKFGGDR